MHQNLNFSQTEDTIQLSDKNHNVKNICNIHNKVLVFKVCKELLKTNGKETKTT